MPKIVHLPQDLYEAVDERAKSQKMTADDLVVAWVSEKIDEPETSLANEAFEREAAAFELLKPELIAQYPNQYVAIFQEKVVAHGNDKLVLVKEVYSQFGEVPCYIGKASSEPRRKARIPSVWKAK